MWLKKFTYLTIEDPDMTISPPFVNSHESVEIDQGDQDWITMWALNACWYLPMFIHLLATDMGNIPVKKSVKDAQVQELCSYVARFHGNNIGMTNCKCHAVMEHRYSALTYSEYTN